MIVTDKFVFVHMHKTGGQSLNDIIKRCIPDHRDVGYHYPRSETPEDKLGLPVVGIIRNPWDWYVSWYAFNKRPQINNPLFNVVSDSGQLNFRATVRNLIKLGADSPASERYRSELIGLLPDSLTGNRGAGLTKDSIRSITESNSGYYSWLAGRMFGDTDDDRLLVGRFENLQADFLDIMRSLAVEETDEMEAALAQRARRNVSHHSHYSHYYDDALRDLVAEQEHGLIERFGYEFAAVKPAGVSYEFPDDAYLGENNGFRKLLGRANSYLQLHEQFDVQALKGCIEKIPAEKWLESERERLFAVHKHTQSVLLVRFEDFKHNKPEFEPLYFELEAALQPLIDYVADYYQNNGFTVRLLLAKLLAGGNIPHHTDAGFSLLNCHRVHIPLITNDEVIFSVGGEEKNMKPGEFWEINNGIDHAVENRSDQDRIHIIVDWMPNFAGLPHEEALKPEGVVENGDGAPAETLEAMIAQAYQVHRAGQAARAESLYRQVLNLDSRNVAANNLCGLLFIQTGRFEEGMRCISTALEEKPDDAQAQANLGLALKGLKRFDEAAQHFHQSLQLNPGNANVYNNLGGIYIELRRIEDAVLCFQQALAIQPALAEAHFNLGSALMQLKRYHQAASSLQQGVDLKPDFEAGRTMLDQARRYSSCGKS